MKTYSPNSALINNLISRYDQMIYESRPVKLEEFLSDKYNKIHIELFNDALKKYYNTTISNLINEKFMFEFFRLLENTYDEDRNIHYENFYNSMNNIFPEKTYIKNVIKLLSIDSDLFIKTIIDITDKYVTDIKNTIIDNNALKFEVLNKLLELSDIGDFRIVVDYDKAIYLGREFINDNAATDTETSNEDATILTYKIEYNEETKTYSLIEEEYSRKNLFRSEDDDYVIILEEVMGTRIEYNSNGEFILILDSATFTSMDLAEFVDNYINKSNKGILKDFREYGLSLYKKNHKVIEIKNDEYWQPSYIIIISNVYPYRKEFKSLEKYWNYSQSKREYNVSDLRITDSQINDAELIEMNYITGMAKMRSKMGDVEFEVPFDYIDQTIGVGEELILNQIK